MNDFYEILGSWLGRREITVTILALLAIVFAGMGVAEAFVGHGYTRHQKNITILVFVLVVVVLVGAVGGLVFGR